MRAAVGYAVLLAAVLAVPADAMDVKIENFVGTVTLVKGNDGLDVVRRGSEGSLDFSTNGEAIHIDGGLSSKERNQACNYGGLSWDLSLNGRESKGNTRLRDYPELRISMPEGSSLEIDDSALELTSEVALGKVDLDVSGCFDISLQDTGDLTLNKSGSGEFEAGSVGKLDIDKSGSGDLTFESASAVYFDASGSGEFEIGDVDGPITIDKSGSGDVEIASANGDVRVEKSGSGDVEIDGGNIPELTINNSGSGDVDVNASVGDAKVNASGSGDIYIESIRDLLYESLSGSAELRRGDD
ncbi:MAG: DUF2807 domain-containing protein [Pseudomonadota bacterium]